MNTFGRLLRLTTFGESHGPAIGGILDGFPADFRVNLEKVKLWNSRRRPGSTALGTRREETDEPEFLSGLQDGITNGAPLAFIIKNKDARPRDYDHLRHVFRPSHADYTYLAKYGLPPAPGGGRASARETAARVTAGALALQWLEEKGISISAWTEQVGTIFFPQPASIPTEDEIYAHASRCPDVETNKKISEVINTLRAGGDSIGGTVRCVVNGLPPGLGEPLYGKLSAMLAAAMFSVNAVKGFDIGLGFNGLGLKGSEQNDAFETQQGRIVTRTNHSGGIQGGISNGMPLSFRILFKPASTLSIPQESVTTSGESTLVAAQGRHDPCVVPRAVPVVQAMTALTLMDAWLLHQSRYEIKP